METERHIGRRIQKIKKKNDAGIYNLLGIPPMA